MWKYQVFWSVHICRLPRKRNPIGQGSWWHELSRRTNLSGTRKFLSVRERRHWECSRECPLVPWAIASYCHLSWRGEWELESHLVTACPCCLACCLLKLWCSPKLYLAYCRCIGPRNIYQCLFFLFLPTCTPPCASWPSKLGKAKAINLAFLHQSRLSGK